jgi:hypothetical protein
MGNGTIITAGIDTNPNIITNTTGNKETRHISITAHASTSSIGITSTRTIAAAVAASNAKGISAVSRTTRETSRADINTASTEITNTRTIAVATSNAKTIPCPARIVANRINMGITRSIISITAVKARTNDAVIIAGIGTKPNISTSTAGNTSITAHASSSTNTHNA